MEKTEVPDLSEMARLVLPELRRILKERHDEREATEHNRKDPLPNREDPR